MNILEYFGFVLKSFIIQLMISKKILILFNMTYIKSLVIYYYSVNNLQKLNQIQYYSKADKFEKEKL